MPPVGSEPTISAGERPQTYALDRAATGTGNVAVTSAEKLINNKLENCESGRVSGSGTAQKFASGI